jgi:hypothetical protein
VSFFGMVLLLPIPRGALPITLQLLRSNRATFHHVGNLAGWILSARSRPVKGLAEKIADVGESLADIGRQNDRPGLISGGLAPIQLYRSSRGGEIFRATAKVYYMLNREGVKDR